MSHKGKGQYRMKTLKRFKNIISSNVNSVLDSIEDPEKMVKLVDNLQKVNVDENQLDDIMNFFK